MTRYIPRYTISFFVGLLCLFANKLWSEELLVGKTCPVYWQQQTLGILVISRPWFHSSRDGAAYQAMDNATGIGVEIHFFASQQGDTRHRNIAACDRFRLLQIRETTAKLYQGENAIQIDIPENFYEPFSDSASLEHGHGTHLTPTDSRDKPWQGQVSRASTVALYDTPYASDAYGLEGQDITVRFDTCAVCERDTAYDSILSCIRWGYQRDFVGGFTGWTEPETLTLQCQHRPAQTFKEALENSVQVQYSYWIDWR